MTQVYSHPKTYFLDIDGTLLKHLEDFQAILDTEYIQPLPGVRETVSRWHCEGHTIIITTARSESMRALTIKQLENAGIVYDQLIMGVTAGVRVLVNDYVPGSGLKADAKNVMRNVDGLQYIS